MMKLPFALTVLLCVVLLSGSCFSAPETSSKQIGDTIVKLLSNTDQCLVDCEAWLEWDLIASPNDVLVASKADNQFNFEFLKKENAVGLVNSGVEVWEAKGKDLIKVADSPYGFSFKKGIVYRLRVWGKKTASLQENDVDWVPTILGAKIGEWAWWNSNWNYKKKITLKTSDYLAGDTTNDHVIPIKQTSADVDFWGRVAQYGQDIRFVNSTETTELDYYLQQFNDAIDEMVAMIEVTDTFTSAANVDVWMYYGNSIASDGQDFENTFPAIYTAYYDFNESAGTTAYDKTSNTYNLTHVNTPTLGLAGQIDGKIYYNSTTSEYSECQAATSLLDEGYTSLSVSTWFSMPTGWSDAKLTDEYVFIKTNAAGNQFSFRFAEADGKLYCRGQAGDFATAKTDWAANTWFNVIFTYDSTADLRAIYVNGSTVDGATSAAAIDALNAGALANFFVGASSTPDQYFDANIDDTAFFRNTILSSNDAILLYRAGTGDLQAYSAAESLVDFNFTSLDSDSFLLPMNDYAYYIDHNLTIGFSLFDSNNSRHVIDINYGTSIADGTGNVIVEDLNLDSSICPTQNWNVVPSACTWDWNIIRAFVPDGNYWLKAKIKTAFAETGFSIASPRTFQIANDVNLLVKVPIDEETGQPIDTSHLYRWTVRIWDETGMRYYQNQIDQNGFLVPLGIADAKLAIDTNTTDFYPRQYKLVYLVPTATDILQPYLIKQIVSVNFIFNVTNINTLRPIGGVQIKVYGYIPDLGMQSIQIIQTDSAGLATIPLRLNSPYTVEFYYNDSLVNSANITPTAASLYYQVQLDISVEEAPVISIGAIKAIFSPTTTYLLQKSTGAVDINTQIYIFDKNVSAIQIRFWDTNGCLFSNRRFTAPWADGNTAIMAGIDLNSGIATNIYSETSCIFSDQFNVFAFVDVNSTDGNQFSVTSIHWNVVQEHNYKYELSYLLGILAGQINKGDSKLATTFLAFFFMLLSVGAVGTAAGGEPITAAMMVMAEMGFFVLVGWVDFVPFLFISIVTFFAMLYMWGRFG